MTPDLKRLYQKLEEKVADLGARLEESHLILEHISEGILFVTKEGVVSLFNPALERLTAVDRKAILHRPFAHYFDDELFGFSMQNALSSSTHHRSLLTLQTPQEEREVEVSATPIQNRGVAVLVQDRTRLYQLEQMVRHNDRLKDLGEMAATLAHEIRNPLGGIEGFASLLAQEMKESSQSAMIAAIIQGSRALNSLVTNVLDYARPLDLHFQPTDLVAIVREAVSWSGKCKEEYQIDSWPISADKERLKLAFLNLLRNAFEVSDEVTVRITKEGIVEIEDRGPGIEKDHLEKIFTPFFTTKTKGTGLGLPEAQKVVQGHGGKIVVESIKGKGTTFRVEL
ncbi:MAG: two-component system sensor histidine kinase NtrB [Chlamydiales bacterium]